MFVNAALQIIDILQQNIIRKHHADSSFKCKNSLIPAVHHISYVI